MDDPKRAVKGFYDTGTREFRAITQFDVEAVLRDSTYGYSPAELGRIHNITEREAADIIAGKGDAVVARYKICRCRKCGDGYRKLIGTKHPKEGKCPTCLYHAKMMRMAGNPKFSTAERITFELPLNKIGLRRGCSYFSYRLCRLADGQVCGGNVGENDEYAFFDELEMVARTLFTWLERHGERLHREVLDGAHEAEKESRRIRRRIYEQGGESSEPIYDGGEVGGEDPGGLTPGDFQS